MADFLHTFHPQAVLWQVGPLTVYWYGFFIVTGVLAAMGIVLKLASYYHQVSSEQIMDLAFWLILGGLLGARLYHVGIEWQYYWRNPVQIFMVWRGGIAIHGAILAGIFIVWWYARRQQLNFWHLCSLIAPGLTLGQAIGRWGNYFNQELFGYPTQAPWGIPIDLAHRPSQYIEQTFFHPTFLYESLGNLVIFVILLTLHIFMIKRRAEWHKTVVMIYLAFYSALRFVMEFIRIDDTMMVGGWRLPQLVSLLILVGVLIWGVVELASKVQLWLREKPTTLAKK